jgi:hypothetical protein
MDSMAAVIKKNRAFRWALAAVPVLFWTIWMYYYSTQKDEIANANPACATAIQQVNQIRETFRCAPLFPSVELEFVLMHAPGTLYSASCLFFTTGILMATASAGRSIESLRSVHGRTMKGYFKLYKTLLFRSLDASNLGLLLLAVGCSMIFVLQIVSTAHLFPQFEEFGSEAQEWATCNLRIAFCGSINTEMRNSDGAEDAEISFILQDCARWAIKYGEGQGCGPTPQNKPSHTIMVLASLTSSLLPLFVSLAFSHKTLRALGRTVVASLKSTTVKPSAVNPVLNGLDDCENGYQNEGSYKSGYEDESSGNEGSKVEGGSGQMSGPISDKVSSYKNVEKPTKKATSYKNGEKPTYKVGTYKNVEKTEHSGSHPKDIPQKVGTYKNVEKLLLYRAVKRRFSTVVRVNSKHCTL